MSFMFNPYPYDDPNAFNVLDPSGLPLSELVEGSGASAAAEAAKAAGALKRAEGWVIAVDGYSTAPLDTFRNLLEQQLALLGIPVTVMAVEELWQEEETLSERLAAENLQEDLEKDPVLLYGKLFSGSYEDLWDLKKRRAYPLGLWCAVRYAAAPMRPEDLSGYYPHEGYAAPQARRIPEYRC